MKTKSVLILAASLLLAGCVSHEHRSHATSLIQYLYPRDAEHVDVPGIPELHLPMKVGIAFVPGGDERPASADSALSAAKQTELLQRVAAQFRGLSSIKSIEIIPSAYLRPAGGFANLEQVRSMFDVDVIALVSYDQIQFTDQGFLSLTYWTIVGAYVVQGERNDTQTLMDTAVYDVASRKLLFRAPGTSQVKASSTPVNLSEELRAERTHGFDLATQDMIGNLRSELDAFKARVKDAPTEYHVIREPGYTGAGAIDGGLALALAGLALAALRRPRS